MTSTRESRVPLGGAGKPAMVTLSDGKSCSSPSGLDEEMMVMAGVGIEIGPAGRDHDFAQQAGIAELVERVVDRGQRNRQACPANFGMQAFRRDMAMFALEQQARQSHPLAGRAQAGRAQAGGKIGTGSGHRWAPYVRSSKAREKAP